MSAVRYAMSIPNPAQIGSTDFSRPLDCGNTTFVGSVQEKGDGFCHMACLGDTTDACGGYSHVSLYKRPGVVGGWP